MPSNEGKTSFASTIFLFDIDGTITDCGQRIHEKTWNWLMELKSKVTIGLVGGSSLDEIRRQLGESHDIEYVFTENGNVAYQNGELIGHRSLSEHLGEEKLQKFINFILVYLGNLQLPFKRGTFIEFRSSILHVSPVGRNCGPLERLQFEKYDQIHSVRSNLVSALETEFASYDLKYSIGGQVGIDIFPIGWDKTISLKYLTNFHKIMFFGDRTYPGGNDYEIFMHPKVTGFKVNSPSNTIDIVNGIIRNHIIT